MNITTTLYSLIESIKINYANNNDINIYKRLNELIIEGIINNDNNKRNKS